MTSIRKDSPATDTFRVSPTDRALRGANSQSRQGSKCHSAGSRPRSSRAGRSHRRSPGPRAAGTVAAAGAGLSWPPTDLQRGRAAPLPRPNVGPDAGALRRETKDPLRERTRPALLADQSAGLACRSAFFACLPWASGRGGARSPVVAEGYLEHLPRTDRGSEIHEGHGVGLKLGPLALLDLWSGAGGGALASGWGGGLRGAGSGDVRARSTTRRGRPRIAPRAAPQRGREMACSQQGCAARGRARGRRTPCDCAVRALTPLWLVRTMLPPSRVLRLRSIHLGRKHLPLSAENSMTPQYCSNGGGALPVRVGIACAGLVPLDSLNRNGNGSRSRETARNSSCAAITKRKHTNVVEPRHGSQHAGQQRRQRAQRPAPCSRWGG